jgi:hypothetical protein
VRINKIKDLVKMKSIVKKTIAIFLLITSSLAFAWTNNDKSSFYGSCVTNADYMPNATARRYCSCMTNMVSTLWTVRQMTKMIKNGTWNNSNKDLQATANWCLTGDY